jgi:hypothetical protein
LFEKEHEVGWSGGMDAPDFKRYQALRAESGALDKT